MLEPEHKAAAVNQTPVERCGIRVHSAPLRITSDTNHPNLMLITDLDAIRLSSRSPIITLLLYHLLVLVRDGETTTDTFQFANTRA